VPFPETSIVLDDFNRADGPVGTSWTPLFGTAGAVVASNQLNPDPTFEAWWNQQTFLDSEVWADIPALDTANGQVGLVARGQPGTQVAPTQYLGRVAAGNLAQFFRSIAGSGTQVGSNISISPSLAAGETIGFSVTGIGPVVLTLYRKPVAGAWGQVGQVNDSDPNRIVTAGFIGHAVTNNTFPTTWRFDNIGGGGIASSTDAIPPSFAHIHFGG
jgi:hypothetical protein